MPTQEDFDALACQNERLIWELNAVNVSMASMQRAAVQIAGHCAQRVAGTQMRLRALSKSLPKALADIVCREVAELPDRTSPADRPDMMLVTHAELAEIIQEAVRSIMARFE